MALQKVTLVQCQVGRQFSIDENLHIYRQRSDFIVLPEYFNVDPRRRDTPLNAAQADEYLKYCRAISDRMGGTLIAGSTVELSENRFYNTSPIYHYGLQIGYYRKRCPTINESKNGISPGHDFYMGNNDGAHFGVLICADVLDPENFIRMRAFKPDIIFVPTTSPFRGDETVKEKYARDHDIFVRGAALSGAYIVKCCAIGYLWGGRLQGRSLIAAPWGIISRINPEDESRERILSAILDIQELRDFRRKQETVEELKQ